MAKAVSTAKSSGLVDPVYGARCLSNLAEFQWRHHDGDGARASARLAVSCGNAVSKVPDKVSRLARCAGLLARLGDREQHEATLQRALDMAQNPGSDYGTIRAYLPFWAKCDAAAEAGDWRNALAFAQAMESLEQPFGRPDRPDKFAVQYARAAYAAAEFGQDTQGGKEAWEQAYVVTCANLGSFDEWDRPEAIAARYWLSRADTTVGAWQRAWIGICSIPWPADRADALIRLARKMVELGQLEQVRDLLQYIPSQSAPGNAVFWLAAAEVGAGDRSLVELKRWAEGRANAEQQAGAFAGIGVGLKFRTQRATPQPAAAVGESQAKSPPDSASEQGVPPATLNLDGDVQPGTVVAEILRKNWNNAPTRRMFDASTGSAPDWWLLQALALARNVEKPSVRACLWVQIARACAKMGDRKAYRAALDRAFQCVVANWNAIAFDSPSSNDSEVGIELRSRGGFVADSAVTSLMLQSLETLWELEALHHEQGETQESLDTLFCALRCAETLPRTPVDAQYIHAWYPGIWMARIAGRLRLRGRADLSELVFISNPWKPTRTSKDVSRGGALAFIEAEETEALLKVAQAHEKASRCVEDTDVAAACFARLAVVAAQAGDHSLYMDHAMSVAGLVNTAEYRARPGVFLELGRAAASLGEADLARQYVERSRTSGAVRDAAIAFMVGELAKRNQVAEARRLAEKLQDEVAKVRARYAIGAAEAAAPTANLSAVFLDVDRYSGDAEKAAAYAGVASALKKK